MVVSLAVSLAGARTAVVVQWLLRLPGELYLNALASLALLLVALHAMLTGSHLACEAASAKLQQLRWMRIAGAVIGAFAASTLLASALGAALAVALRGIIPRSEILAQAWGLPSGASVAFSCPGDAANESLSLQSDGTLACSENVTVFVLDDVARTFVVESQTTVLSVAEQLVKVVESVFPATLAGGLLAGDVLSLLVGGLALGMALKCYLSTKNVEISTQVEENLQDRNRVEEGEEDEETGCIILQLFAHAESTLCSLLEWVLKYVPFGAIFTTCSTLLYSSSTESADITGVAAAALALVAVLLLALVLDVVAMLTLATLLTQSNPFAFVKHVVSAQFMALSSGSALVALPATVASVVSSECVSSPLAFVVCTASTVLNQTGTAIYLSVGTVFVLSASTSGMNRDEQVEAEAAGNIVTMIFANVVIACVISPFPGAAKTTALTTTLGVLFGVSSGTRAVLLAFLAGMQWITDPIVACVNVTNNALVALVIAHFFEDKPVPVVATEPTESGAPTQELSGVSSGELRNQTQASNRSAQTIDRGLTLASINSANWV